MELEILLDAGAQKPLYEQIYMDIRGRIYSGELKSGERLPATRILARNLQVARSTVELAYEQLESEGYVEIRPGSGAYICSVENLSAPGIEWTGQGASARSAENSPGRSAPCMEVSEFPRASARSAENSSGQPGQPDRPASFRTGQPDRTVSSRSEQPDRAVSSRSRQSDRTASSRSRQSDRTASSRSGQPDRAVSSRSEQPDRTGIPAGESFIDFSPRTIDMDVFPYATWRRILRGILTGDRAELFARGDPQGDPALRGTIARYLHLSRGCVCTPEQVVIGAGNDYLLMLLGVVLGEGRRIGMESPTYMRAAQIMEAMHETVVPVRSDASGLDAASLEEADCSLVYCMPARQYPTGVSMPWPRRAQLLRWAAADPDRYIIEDDYDSEFRYRGRPVPSLQSQDQTGRVIYMGTFSKSIAPAIRVSYLVLPPRLLPLFRERAHMFSCTVPRIDQSVLDEFIREGYYERYLNRMRTRYRARHDLMLELLAPLSGRFEVAGQGAGLHLLLRIREDEGDSPEVMTSGEPGGAYAEKEKNSAGCTGADVSSPHLHGEAMRLRNILIEREYAQRAAKAGVRVYPMSEMYLDGPIPEGQVLAPTLLLGYASLSEEEIRSGIRLLKEAFEM